MLWGVVTGIVFGASALWVLLTQPTFSKSSSKSPGMVATTTDPQRLRMHVEVLSTTFVPRDWRHIDNLDRTATYISQALAAAGTEVSEQPYPMQANNENHGKTYRNVVGKLGPDTQDRIVVGAHYDAFGEYPGADDNASGVAALIEVARLLAKETLPLGVDLIAYSVEEPFTKDARGNFRTPDGGSAIHAASLKRAGARVRLMFSLETLGYFDLKPSNQPVIRLFIVSEPTHLREPATSPDALA